ncbi:MAG: hypothetical protein R2685_16180 [Candidatus Nitrosocosmicus sp.]|nr:hypothetical protein [Candidatus Nitrosocosmicus sp.]
MEPLNAIVYRHLNNVTNTTNSLEERVDKFQIELNRDENYQKQSKLFNEKLKTIDPYAVIYNFLMSTTYPIIYMILPISISILVKLLLERYRKLFTLYYAKGCFQLIEKEKMEIDKAKYLLEGLFWYNRFLRKNMHLQLNDLIKIYSKIITNSPIQQNKEVNLLSKSFESTEELVPLRNIACLYPNTVEQILTSESLRNRIKESSDLLIPIISVIITVITTFLLPRPH